MTTITTNTTLALATRCLDYNSYTQNGDDMQAKELLAGDIRSLSSIMKNTIHRLESEGMDYTI